MSFITYLKEVIKSDSSTSAKRFVTLLISFHFIFAAFVILFIAVYVVFYTTKGRVDVDLINLLKELLKDDLMIIMSGLGFISIENAGEAFIEVYKLKNTEKISSSNSEIKE